MHISASSPTLLYTTAFYLLQRNAYHHKASATIYTNLTFGLMSIAMEYWNSHIQVIQTWRDFTAVLKYHELHFYLVVKHNQVQM